MAVDPSTYIFPNVTPYHYTHNNPINRHDPDGRTDWAAFVKSSFYTFGAGVGVVTSGLGMISATAEEAATGGLGSAVALPQFFGSLAMFSLSIEATGENFANMMIAWNTPGGMKAAEYRVFNILLKKWEMDQYRKILPSE